MIILKSEGDTLVVSRGWVIFHGRDEGNPFWNTDPDTLLYVLYRNGQIIGPKRAQRFRWLHCDDNLDVIAYILANQFGVKGA